MLGRSSDTTPPAVRERVGALGFRRTSGRSDEREHQRSDPGGRARRRVVEATHSWLNRNRWVLIRWCIKRDNNRALLHLAPA